MPSWVLSSGSVYLVQDAHQNVLNYQGGVGAFKQRTGGRQNHLSLLYKEVRLHRYSLKPVG